MNKRSRTSPTPSTESVEMKGLKKELGSINDSSDNYYDQFNGVPHGLVGAAMMRLFVNDVMGTIITTVLLSNLSSSLTGQGTPYANIFEHSVTSTIKVCRIISTINRSSSLSSLSSSSSLS
jgi:uncharacterized membrane protein YjjP (DUF1212 family)